jgi:hypothetical protein
MRVSGIIHQQICQLKWHLLACLGLTMVLPIEEAVVNLKAGDGFFTTTMAFPAILFGPLLAALIACANVQGDLNEKRYIFWRSKPANVKLLITIKFFTGLAVSLLIIACPVIFAFVSNSIWNEDGIERVFFKYYVPLPVMIAIMTYSLCFACNVVVRKTARAWLIGMLTGCFLLVLPFMLPLDFKDFVSDVKIWSWGPYLAILLVTPAAAFVFALYAAKNDWHLRTNLKGLLWIGAGLVFLLLMLFSSQVANIKILQEKEIEFFGLLGSHIVRPSIEEVGEKLIFQGTSYIDIHQNKISLSDISKDTDYGIAYLRPKRVVGYHVIRYPHNRHGSIKFFGNNVYRLVIHAYLRKEEEGAIVKTFLEKVYLRSYKHNDRSWMPVCELDISDCLTNNKRWIRIAMRLIDNKLFVRVNNSYALVNARNPGELKLIDKKLDVLQQFRPIKNRKKEFSIPLVPVEEFGLEERIRLSIDLNYRSYYDNEIYESSIVDIHDDKFAFALIEHDEVARYDVTRWDDENIYCKFSASRPYTILEGVAGTPGRFSPQFVKNGKLYCRDYNTLLVFDIRSKRRIRKLGHFVRMNYHIEDMAVLENGNILLGVQQDYDLANRYSKVPNTYLYLLKNPE